MLRFSSPRSRDDRLFLFFFPNSGDPSSVKRFHFSCSAPRSSNERFFLVPGSLRASSLSRIGSSNRIGRETDPFLWTRGIREKSDKDAIDRCYQSNRTRVGNLFAARRHSYAYRPFCEKRSPVSTWPLWIEGFCGGIGSRSVDFRFVLVDDLCIYTHTHTKALISCSSFPRFFCNCRKFGTWKGSMKLKRFYLEFCIINVLRILAATIALRYYFAPLFLLFCLPRNISRWMRSVIRLSPSLKAKITISLVSEVDPRYTFWRNDKSVTIGFVTLNESPLYKLAEGSRRREACRFLSFRASSPSPECGRDGFSCLDVPRPSSYGLFSLQSSAAKSFSCFSPREALEINGSPWTLTFIYICVCVYARINRENFIWVLLNVSQ